MNKLFSKGNYIKRLMKRKGITQESLTDRNSELYLGYGRNTLINILSKSDFEDGLETERVKVLLSRLDPSKEDMEYIFPSKSKSNAKAIGEYEFDEEGDDQIQPLGDDRYALTAEFVPVKARAGYLVGYADPEFLETLPKYTATVSHMPKGKYRYFEAEGDSMNDGTIENAILDGTVLQCRKILPHHWAGKLHSHKWTSFVFVHRTEGIIVKQVAEQNLDTGDVVLRSINPDKSKYPDFTVNLDDIREIYNVVKRIL
jgi:transcriptional regulator with XRE-family HTH domain